jgi:hypothetical protein
MTEQRVPAGWYPVDGGQQRYWDGSMWTDHTAPAATDEARRAALSAALGQHVSWGCVVVERDAFSAIVTGARPAVTVSHGLHFVACLLTCFLWLPVWIVAAARAKGPQPYTLRLDVGVDGQVIATEISPAAWSP